MALFCDEGVLFSVEMAELLLCDLPNNCQFFISLFLFWYLKTYLTAAERGHLSYTLAVMTSPCEDLDFDSLGSRCVFGHFCYLGEKWSADF
jgi:hypothetical protein